MTSASADPKRACFRVLLGVSALLVLTTLIFRFHSRYFLWLAPLNLTEENVIAAWFSGMLLLLGSILAADGYFRLRNTHFKAALAWWVIAAMLMALSLDEIACLHERIEYWRTGPILSFVPFLFVLIGGCAWSFVQLWLTPSERPKVKWLIVGFAILVSIGGQEILERIVPLTWYIRPFRAAFEEGSELAGMLLLIHTTMQNSSGLFDDARPARGPKLDALSALRWPIVIGALLIAWPVASLTAFLDEQAALGHFSDWLSCALLLFAAATVARRWALATPREDFPTSAVVLLCAASATCVQFDPIGDQSIFPGSSTLDFLGMKLNTRFVLLGLCCLGAAEALRTRGRSFRSCAALLAATGVASLVSAAMIGPYGLEWAYFATTVIATGAFGAVALTSREAATTVRIDSSSTTPSTP